MADLAAVRDALIAGRACAALLETHDGLEEAQMHALNARLILILANHIGDTEVLTQALQAARKTS